MLPIGSILDGTTLVVATAPSGEGFELGDVVQKSQLHNAGRAISLLRNYDFRHARLFTGVLGVVLVSINEHDDVCIAPHRESLHGMKACRQIGPLLQPITGRQLGVLDANVPTNGVHWAGHGDCNPGQPAKSLSREAHTELQLRRSCESWSDIRFARPPGRSETCENHRETIKIIRTRTENEHKHQHLPKS